MTETLMPAFDSEWAKNPTAEMLLSKRMLSCPRCDRSDLIQDQIGVSCPGCGARYPVSNGVLDFFFLDLEDAVPEDILDIEDAFVHALIGKIPLDDTPDNLHIVRNILLRLAAKSYAGHQLAEIHSIAKRFGIPESDAAIVKNPSDRARSGLAEKSIDFRIRFERHYIPHSLPCGVSVYRNVRFTNCGNHLWSSDVDRPIYMSYHWYNRQNECICWDGARTPFPVDILPGGTLSLPLRIVTPDLPGEWRLNIVLVHEGVRWIEETKLEIPVAITLHDESERMLVDRHPDQPDYGKDHALGVGMLADYVARRYQGMITVLEIGGACHPQCAGLPNCNLVVLDISLPLQEMGSVFFRERGRKDILFICADGTKPPFISGTFDGIVIFSSLHHLPEPDLSLKNLNRILKPDGFLGVFCEPVASSMDDANLKEELRKGINEQVFCLEEYDAMFKGAGFRPYVLRLDGGSLKAILTK